MIIGPSGTTSRDRKIQAINNDITRNRNAFANAVDTGDSARMNELQAEYERLSLKLDEQFKR